MSSDDKPRRFAQAVAVLRKAAEGHRVQAWGLGGVDGAADVAHATECEAAAALLEAAEGETA
jgi:hypothetical protein